MFTSVHDLVSRDAARMSRFALSHGGFAILACVLEFVAITAVAVLSGMVWHYAVYGQAGQIEHYAAIGLLTAMTYCLSFLLRDEYGLEYLLEGRRGNARLFLFWNMAFATLAVIGFLTKSTADFSRGWLLMFYISGFLATIVLNGAINRGLTAMISRGLIRRRKLMLVGTPDDITRLERHIADGAGGFFVSARLPVDDHHSDNEETEAALQSAVSNARMLGIQDVIISNALSSPEFLERCVTAFSLLPVAIHVGTGGIVDRFKDARIARFGRAATLSLTREPLGPFEAFAKRAFDITLSSVALVLLSPVFLIIAALIKLDSRGPVFFLQRRRGYNLEEFAIWKFRTMTTMDDGDVVKQATQGDARVTAIGRILRRYSLDELPQLINVLKGEMSLVGPRPHAVAHDRFFENRIEAYPRRLNMKPGITGWAQVNGFRGATETDGAMRQRVEHDLYYIDNWSVAFDVYIIVLTIVSRKASANAY